MKPHNDRSNMDSNYFEIYIDILILYFNHQLQYMASLINTKANVVLRYPKINIFENRTFLCLDIKSLSKNSLGLLEVLIEIRSIYNIILQHCKIRDSTIRKYLR